MDALVDAKLNLLDRTTSQDSDFHDEIRKSDQEKIAILRHGTRRSSLRSNDEWRSSWTQTNSIDLTISQGNDYHNEIKEIEGYHTQPSVGK